MSEEGDIPSVTKSDKSTAPTLLQRFGSLTGTKKSKENAKLTKENEALKKEVAQLTKEAEERQGKIDQYESKSTIISKLTNEVEERKREIDQYKRKNDDENEKWTLKMDAVNVEVQSKSTEIDYLKNRITQLEDENNSKSAKIENLNIEMSQDVRNILEKVVRNSIDLKILHNKTPDIIHRARFTGISKLTSNWVFSRWTIAGVKWDIRLIRMNDHLYANVFANNYCTASVVLQVISQKNENIVHSKNVTEYGQCWGFNNFISLKDLFDEEKGYVKDDSIIFAAVIKVFPDAQ